jgi:hypothetical protein
MTIQKASKVASQVRGKAACFIRSKTNLTDQIKKACFSDYQIVNGVLKTKEEWSNFQFKHK